MFTAILLVSCASVGPDDPQSRAVIVHPGTPEVTGANKALMRCVRFMPCNS
jgi:hypothetical protein